MKNKKLLMVMVGIVAIGMFALPSTLSVGAGQHNFTTVTASDPTTVAAWCERCHGTGMSDAIQAELDASTSGVYHSGSKIHSLQTCYTCHGLVEGYADPLTNPSGAGANHAAILPSCLDCHGSASVMNDVSVEFGATEAHNDFTVVGDDDAHCIACHTDVKKAGTITFSYKPGFNFNGFKVGDNV